MQRHYNNEVKLTCDDFGGVSSLWVVNIQSIVYQWLLILETLEDVKVEMWGHFQPQTSHIVNGVQLSDQGIGVVTTSGQQLIETLIWPARTSMENVLHACIATQAQLFWSLHPKTPSLIAFPRKYVLLYWRIFMYTKEMSRKWKALNGMYSFNLKQ